jgi:DNA-directed RNA polymerase specialized sigma24 family protein
MQAITHRPTAMTSRPADTLVDRAASGDTAAFEQLCRENNGRIYALCLRMTGSPGEAEELTQQAFIRAWEKLHTFRGEASCSTWMHPLAANIETLQGAVRIRRQQVVPGWPESPPVYPARLSVTTRRAAIGRHAAAEPMMPPLSRNTRTRRSNMFAR